MRWMLWALIPASLMAQDPREDFQAVAWLALSQDTFAAAARRDALYLNPEESGQRRERLTGGFEFQARLLGAGKRQVWIYGRSSHGARSLEVTRASDPGRVLLQLLRNSSSLEAHSGIRFEIASLNPQGTSPIQLYAQAQAGFFTVAQSGGDALDVHQITVGLLATRGRYAGSYLEGGWGRNNVFQWNRYRRVVLNARLAWASPEWRDRGMRPFVGITLDGDGGSGADTIQTAIGFTFNLNRIF